MQASSEIAASAVPDAKRPLQAGGRGSPPEAGDGPERHGADTLDADDGPVTPGAGTPPNCCPFFHEAVELVGKRWTGAILRVLMERPLRFSEVAHSVPELSDRLLSARMKELEARGIVERRVEPGPPLRVHYSLSPMGRELEPALTELERWARRWLRAGARTG